MHDIRTEADEPRRRDHRGLVVVNLVLLLLLAVVTFAPDAGAQQRPRGDYNMVGGGAQGANTGVVYILDGANQELIAVTYDRNAKQIKGVGYRSLMVDEASLLRRRN